MTLVPQFPGGMDTAPEVTTGAGCACAGCSCTVEPGHTYCCRACARAGDGIDFCPCGHFGCSARAW